MRVGLLSEPSVIERVNQQFVCTWVLVHDARKLARDGNTLAKTLAENWEYPMDIMFLTSDGALVSKLNSFRDLRQAHPDVGHPPDGRGLGDDHLQTFIRHVDAHFGGGVATGADQR